MTHDEMIAIIQAHKEGKTIEYLDHDDKSWKEKENTKNFLFEDYIYRIKPEQKEITREKVTKKVIQFTFEDMDLFRDKWIRHKIHDFQARINIIRKDGISLSNGSYSYETAFNELEFIDGSPFGKEVWE